MARATFLPTRRWRTLLAVGATLALIAAACGGSDAPPSDGAAASATPSVPPGDTATSEPREDRPAQPADPTDPASADPGGRGVIAGIDTSIRSVDLSQIEYDLFNGASITLDRISESDIMALIDVIPPLDTNRDLLDEDTRLRVGEVHYIPAADADFLADDMSVLGYIADDGQAYAYSIAILNFHEIVNDTLGGRAVVITYCPLCRSGVVYERTLDGQVLTFGNSSALFQNDLVMFDRQTTSYWFQVGGEAVVGTLTGSRLTALPSVMMPWATWRQQHPDTLVLSDSTGFSRRYDVDSLLGYENSVNNLRLPFSVDDEILADDRLMAGELVLGVEVGETARAYPLNQLGDAAVNDDIDGQPIVIFSSAVGPSGAAYDPTLGDARLNFEFIGDAYRDVETRSLWDFTGLATEGELAGRRLTLLPSRTAFWFSYLSAFPSVTVSLP
jgi:hypothetical protein